MCFHASGQLLLSLPLVGMRESNIVYYSKTAECWEIDLGSICLFRLEYALKSEDQGHTLQRATRIYGIDCKSESAT